MPTSLRQAHPQLQVRSVTSLACPPHPSPKILALEAKPCCVLQCSLGLLRQPTLHSAAMILENFPLPEMQAFLPVYGLQLPLCHLLQQEKDSFTISSGRLLKNQTTFKFCGIVTPIFCHVKDSFISLLGRGGQEVMLMLTTDRHCKSAIIYYYYNYRHTQCLYLPYEFNQEEGVATTFF